jgi:spore maturation protein CgeB
VPVISDRWDGLEAFFVPDDEIVIADHTEAVLGALVRPEAERRAIGVRARVRVLAEHTAEHRAEELEAHVLDRAGVA